jgi:hypothetical protein
MYPCLLVIIRGRLVDQILMYASPFCTHLMELSYEDPT